MRPFDLSAAMRGEPIMTREGKSAILVGYCPQNRPEHQVVISYEGGITSRYDNGAFGLDRESPYDLVMVADPEPKMRTFWVNCYGRKGVWTPVIDVFDNQADADHANEQFGLKRRGNRAWPIDLPVE